MAVEVGQLVGLLKALARLALSVEEQVDYLRQLGVLPSVDELALELQDRLALVSQLQSNGWLSSSDAEAIGAVDALLHDMSGPGRASLWTQQALVDSSEWRDVRRAASAFFTGNR